MTDKIKKEGSYASLKGFKKAVPIILGILGIFIAFCLITQSTGIFGAWIAKTIRGLFSAGAYFIPAFLIIHAFLYPSDIYKKRLTARIIFSVVALIMISAFSHTVSNIGSSYGFEVGEFYFNGQEGVGGGFFGGILAYLLSSIIGSVGVIILSVIAFIAYLAFFFISCKKTISKITLKILTVISDASSRSKQKRAEKAAKEAEYRKAEEIRRQENLTNDDFFESDESLSSLTIAELGIKEVKYSNSVTAPKQNETANEIPAPKEAEEQKPRRVSFDYGIDNSLSAPKNAIAEPQSKPASQRAAYGLDERADDVFNKDFNAFDFKINQELAAKPSSRASEIKKTETINEIATPIYKISAEDVEKARQRADFEMKKKAAIEAREELDRINSNLPKEETLEFGERPANDEPPVAEITPTVNEAPAAMAAPVISEAVPVQNEETQIGISRPTVSEYIEPTLEIKRVTPIKEEKTEQASFSDAEPETAVFEQIKQEPSLVAEEIKPSETETILMAREILEPEISISDDEKEDDEPTSSTFQVDEEDSDTSMSFEFSTVEDDPTESEEGYSAENEVTEYVENELSSDIQEDAEEYGEDELPVEEITEEEDEDNESYYEEIPEEEQNPKINEYRKMFSFLEDENESDENLNEVSEQSAEAVEVAENDIIIADFDEKDEAEDNGTPPFDEGRFTFEKTKPSFEAPPPSQKKSEEAPKPDYSNYKFPPIDLLHLGQVEEDENADEETKENADKLVETLAQFSVKVSLKGYDRGPRITRYEIVPAKGVKVNQVTNLFDDIALNMAAEGIRMEAPIPGKSAIGIEIPNKKPALVCLRDLIETDDFMREESKTCAAIGKDVTGNPVFGDISKMPHVLIAGATGMGKSVCINAALISILYKARPDEVKFIMIDPKRVEFNSYNGIPHLLIPVVTDVKQAAGALMWAVEQMEKRYDLMGALEVKKLDEYNDLVRENPSLGEPLPKIIIVIDELNDIMLQARKPVEGLIMSIAQKARAAGIHLILGTQRPSVDVITGVIKSNIPSRISCKVMSFQDSKTIIDQSGAEKLLNNGDMLYFPNGSPKPLRVQGAYVSNSEVSKIMKHLKDQAKGQNVYDQRALDEINNAAKKCVKGGADDEGDDDGQEENTGIFHDQQFLDAVELAIKSGKISTSLIQRRIGVGYGKAAKFIDYMEDQGIVSEPNGQKPRDILITKDDWYEMLNRRSID